MLKSTFNQPEYMFASEWGALRKDIRTSTRPHPPTGSYLHHSCRTKIKIHLFIHFLPLNPWHGMSSVNRKWVDELWMETGVILDRIKNLMRVVHKKDPHLAKLMKLKAWHRNAGATAALQPHSETWGYTKQKERNHFIQRRPAELICSAPWPHYYSGMMWVRTCCVWMCVFMCFVRCGDINLFMQSYRDLPSLWGQNANAHDINHSYLGSG